MRRTQVVRNVGLVALSVLVLLVGLLLVSSKDALHASAFGLVGADYALSETDISSDDVEIFTEFIHFPLIYMNWPPPPPTLLETSNSDFDGYY